MRSHKNVWSQCRARTLLPAARVNSVDAGLGAVRRGCSAYARLSVLLTVVVAAGAFSAATARAAAGSSPTKVERFLLTTSDLPAGYKLEERKRFSSRGCPDRISPVAVRKQLTKLGFRGCALAMFGKEVDVGNGVSYLHYPESVAVLMRDKAAASAALRVLRRMLLASLPTELGIAVHSLPVSRLGDQAPRGLTFAFGEINAFIYIWRRGNVVAWTSSSDILHDFDAGAALSLARSLDARGAS